MRGDFSRITYDSDRQFTRVLMQQGRPWLDADWNEQVEIQTNELRGFIKSFFGWHGTSYCDWDAFSIKAGGALAETTVGVGAYYVDGYRCVNKVVNEGGNGESNVVKIYQQPFLEFKPDDIALKNGRYIVYLDVWERNLSWANLYDPENKKPFRESALQGRDTATRAQLIWQIRLLKLPQKEGEDDFDLNEMFSSSEFEKSLDDWAELEDSAKTKNDNTVAFHFTSWQPKTNVKLNVKTRSEANQIDDSCEHDYEMHERNSENQLYRIEIHQASNNNPTFKWCRENGSISYPVESIDGQQIKIQTVDSLFTESLKRGDWVEIADDKSELNLVEHPLRQIENVDSQLHIVTLSPMKNATSTKYTNSAVIRRWHPNGSLADESGVAIPVKKTLNEKTAKEEYPWISLEHGIKVQFDLPFQNKARFRKGDYWIFAVRGSSIEILDGELPKGIQHHVAPLDIISNDDANKLSLHKNYRRIASYQPIDSGQRLVQTNVEPDKDEKIKAAEDVDPTGRVIDNTIFKDGQRLVNSLIAAGDDVIRAVPAKYLRYEVKSEPLRQWLGRALVSEIAGQGLGQFMNTVKKTVKVAEDEHKQFEADAGAILELANQFYQSLQNIPVNVSHALRHITG